MNEDEPAVQRDPVTNLAKKPPGYRSYILRCWETPSLAAGHPGDTFRFSLEDPATGERQGFANIQALTEFLQSSMNAGSTPTRTPGAG